MCEPGVSTAKEVTSVSGRGVGMDVVRANLEKMGGSIMIDSTPGAGTRIMLNVPLTLSIVPSITVGVGEQRFAIPRSYVEEIVRGGTDEAQLAKVGGRLLVTIRGRRVPCIALGAGLIREVERVAGAPRREDAEAEAAANHIPALLFVGFDGRRRAVPMSAVDRVETLDASAVRLEGDKSQVVIEGRILPLVAAEGADLADGTLELFRLSDGHAETAYAFSEMVDTALIDRNLAPGDGRQFVAGCEVAV